MAKWSCWKDFLYPGNVVVPGRKGPLVYKFTTGSVNHIIDNGNAKITAGWAIPLCWEHQDVQPERVQLSQGQKDINFARGVFGFLKAFAPTPDGRGKVLLEGDDPADYKQLEKVKFVSPEIEWDWQDSTGKVWRGPTVTHLAATPRPVQPHQHPVGANPDLPPIRPTEAKSLENLVRLSFSSHDPNRPGVGHRLRLSLANYGGANAMAANIPGLNGKDPTTEEGGDKKSPWIRIAAALAKGGIKIGTGENIKDPDHLADLIEVACMNSEAAETDDLDNLPNEDEEDENPNGDMEAPPPDTAAAPPPPVQMSLEAQTRKREAFCRKNIESEIDLLVHNRQITPAIENPLRSKAKTVRLSFTATGDLEPNEVTTQIAAFKQLPRNAAWSPTGARDGKKPKKKARLSVRANTTEAERSPYEERSPADDAQIVEAWESHVGRA